VGTGVPLVASLMSGPIMQNAQKIPLRTDEVNAADQNTGSAPDRAGEAVHDVPEPDMHGLHPQSRMSNDFLNHYNELVMLLEMLPGMPDCFADIDAWTPKSYISHFEGSGLHWSDYAIAEYEHLGAEWKVPFERILAIIDAFLNDAIALLRTVVHNEHFERDPTISLMIVTTAQGLLGQLNHIIAGGHVDMSGHSDPFDVDDAQALADALF
jgi:hypothetical protein